jgi:hypothetical protein
MDFFNRCLISLICIVASQQLCAHQLKGGHPPASWAAQVSLDSVGLAYYTDNHAYVYGFDMGPYQWYDKSDNKYDAWDWSIFFRKNFRHVDTLDAAIGFSYGSHLGKEADNGEKINYWHTVSTYVFLEWEATRKIEIGGGFSLVNYTDKKIDSHRTKKLKAIDGLTLQLSYFLDGEPIQSLSSVSLHEKH